MKPSCCSKLLALFCLSLLLLGCSRGQPPQLEPLESQAVILAFGDSLTHGSGAKSEEAYPRVLERLIQRQVVIEAHPGDKTSDGLHKLASALDQHQPELLLLCMGGNDFLRKVPPETTQDNLRRMIEMARASGIDVLLLGVPKPALVGMKAHPLYQELAEQFGLPLENQIMARVLSDRATKSDPIHPNAAGYRKIAQAVAQLLRQTGALTP